MSGRKLIAMRIATTHPIAAYGGVRLSPNVLEQIAEAVRTGATPIVLHHNRMNDLGARCLRAEIVDTDDGFKALDAEVEVDAEAWDKFKAGLDALGVPGGMSFTGSEPITELPPRDAAIAGQFAVLADAGYFSDSDITAAASELTAVGAVRVARLYQFSAVQACRIIIEYVHDTSGPSGATIGIGIGIGLVSASIYDCVKHLLLRRPATPGQPTRTPIDRGQAEPGEVEPAQIEIHTTTTPGGVTVQTFQIRTNDEAVLRAALDHIAEAATDPARPVVEWDEARSVWREP